MKPRSDDTQRSHTSRDGAETESVHETRSDATHPIVPSLVPSIARSLARRGATPHPSLWLDPTDRLILLHCAQSPQPVRDLLQHCSRGSLYRHLGKLLKAGAVTRIGRTYEITSLGIRWMADAEAHIEWNALESWYPPLAEVPTAHYKALLQLIAAAVVARQAGLRDDHHPAFVAMGRTLKWKTSCGRFACSMFGVDPQVHIIDLGSETTGSLFTRRSSQGWLISQRSVLTSPFVGFDDVLQAEAPVRAALAPFVSGRRSVPFEHGLIPINCVSFLTMNPRDRPTLEAQTTFNPAQLRRLVLLNCDAVPDTMDLALSGHRALESAQEYGPLRLPTVRTDLREHLTAVVHLIRAVVRPEMHERIDSELVLLLAAGMSGFVEEDERAIQQTVHDLGLMMETLGWTAPAWSTAVSQFSLYATRHVVIPPHPVPPAYAADPVTEDKIILRRRLMDQQHNSDIPTFSISESARARLVWIAVEEQVSYADAIDILTDYYSAAKGIGLNLEDFHSILTLSKELAVRDLPVREVRFALTLRQYLTEHHLGVPDLDLAVHLLKLLQQFGLTAESGRVPSLLEVACKLDTSDVSLADVEDWLARRKPSSRP